MERLQPDFVVEGPDRGTRLVVEARNVVAPTAEWLVRYLHNLFTLGAIPRSDYVLLALRDHLYLWRRPALDVQRPPDFEGETATVLAPYLRMMIPHRLETMTENGFESLVFAWLVDLVAGTEPEPEAAKWLEGSGLPDSIRNGTITAQTAA